MFLTFFRKSEGLVSSKFLKTWSTVVCWQLDLPSRHNFLCLQTLLRVPDAALCTGSAAVVSEAETAWPTPLPSNGKECSGRLDKKLRAMCMRPGRGRGFICWPGIVGRGWGFLQADAACFLD